MKKLTNRMLQLMFTLIWVRILLLIFFAEFKMPVNFCIYFPVAIKVLFHPPRLFNLRIRVLVLSILKSTETQDEKRFDSRLAQVQMNAVKSLQANEQFFCSAKVCSRSFLIFRAYNLFF